MESDGNPELISPNTENAEPNEQFLENDTSDQIRINIRDLICWSFQIASGMNHLAKKKVY